MECRGGVGRRQRDDWCFVRVNAYCDWVRARRNSGGEDEEREVGEVVSMQ